MKKIIIGFACLATLIFGGYQRVDASSELAFTKPPLPYAYDALEPYIDAKTMEIHYTKHHQAYTDKLNALIPGHERFFKGKTIEAILSEPDQIPAEIRQGVIDQGGGFANHNLFWRILSPNGGGQPTGVLAEAITCHFDTFDTFKETLNKELTSLFGSGWAWLVVNEDQQLEIIKTANQDSPLSLGKTPILGIDVWEHAYYLKYQNRRPEYIDAIWNVINWDEVSKRYEEAIK
ncbi:MAG: superoxide dismutase [Defluviitaleaceae bacterium]|nr:superoxide dismutase [Defluviitaleaceae bacterium]